MWLCPRAALLPAAAVLPVLHSELLPFPIAFFHLESLSHRFVASGRSPPSQHPVHLQLGLSDLQRSLLQSDARTKPRFAGNALFAATTGAECFAGGFPQPVPLCALRHTGTGPSPCPSSQPGALSSGTCECYPYREVRRSGGVRGALRSPRCPQPAAPSRSWRWGWPRVPWDAGRSCEHPRLPAALPAARARPRSGSWIGCGGRTFPF